MTIFGDGTQQRAFTYIGDIAPIIACSPMVERARNRIFNVGADEPYSVNRLAHEVAKSMGVRPVIEYLPARTEVSVAYADHAAVRTVFGRENQTSLEEGLSRMAAWVRAVGSRKSADFGNIEVRRNMPPSWISSVRDEAFPVSRSA